MCVQRIRTEHVRGGRQHLGVRKKTIHLFSLEAKSQKHCLLLLAVVYLFWAVLLIIFQRPGAVTAWR